MDRDSASDARVARMLVDRGQEMSDCSTNAWRISKWTDQVWHAPSGRDIHISQDEAPHEVELEYPDGTHRYIHYAGGLPVRVRIDGTEYASVDDVR